MKNKRKPGSGGLRKGAGRKPIMEKSKAILVLLPASDVERLKQRGKVSTAAREIIQAALHGAV